MKITLLGTGTPTPSLKRMCSGYVVETGDDVLVFDHGAGAHHRLLESGILAVDVTHFICSHLAWTIRAC
jgi:ribonuclease BN (tRNA processing enzyme)